MENWVARYGAGLQEAIRVTPLFQRRKVSLKFQLSDKTVFAKALIVDTREVGLAEGESDHKRLFATDSVECANVYFLRKTVGHALLVRTHLLVSTFSRWAGNVADRLGLKARLKKMLRFGR